MGSEMCIRDRRLDIYSLDVNQTRRPAGDACTCVHDDSHDGHGMPTLYVSLEEKRQLSIARSARLERRRNGPMAVLVDDLGRRLPDEAPQ